MTIIEERLKKYSPQTLEDEQNALKEILQEIVLYGLSSADFFNQALFYGGTSLRIVHNLPRFSEDLYFLLKVPNKDFRWEPFLEKIILTCKAFGVEPEMHDRSTAGKAVQKMFLKDNSIGKILDLKFHHHPGKQFMIKLEVDTNPPAGSKSAVNFISYPIDYSVVTQDLASSFSGKCHALLCRRYIKGRDWFDFIWYVNQKIKPNFELLTNAIDQQGPWADQALTVDGSWLCNALVDKINTINWQSASQEVSVFLRTLERRSLSIWSSEFFLAKLNELQHYL